jgi:hypothetical protein
MMAAIPRKRSLADMQNTDAAVPAEYSDENYFCEVLQLEEGQTEASFDVKLAQEAEMFGVTISRPPTANGRNENHNSVCESALTGLSHHARTASSGSQGSASTSMTSRSSNEQLDNATPLHARKRPISRRSLSFTEYEKYLAQHEAQEAIRSGVVPPPIPMEPAPSLFSVSTRRSYVNIKKGIKSKFRLRTSKGNQDDSK